MGSFELVSRDIFRKSILQRDELIQQRDELIQQRDELIQQRDLIFNSTIWKYTRFIRITFSILKKLKRSKKPFKQLTSSIDCLKSNLEFYSLVLRAKKYSDSIETLRYALRSANVEGIALEFGVFNGRTLGIIAERYPGMSFGFDSFNGLPEEWREGYPKGTFKIEEIPKIENASIIPGLFQETLRNFLSKNSEPISFVHLDADLYSSTKFVLSTLNDQIKPNSIIVFDEFMNYPKFEKHEYLAYFEWCNENGRICEPICFTDNHEQMGFKVIK